MVCQRWLARAIALIRFSPALCALLLGAVWPLLPGGAEVQAAAPGQRAECVVLLHGFGRTSLSMLALVRALNDAGYRVVNDTYPSLFYDIETLAERAVADGIEDCRTQTPVRIHFVTHSLGGILVRAYLADHPVADLGRVVMLGPPNQGSSVAAYLSGFSWLTGILPPVIGQLSPDDGALPTSIGAVDFELGVIAGTRNRRPFTPGQPDGPGDGTVSVAETRVEGMQDFVTLPVSHTFMAWDRTVIAQTLAFMHNGRFDPVAAQD